VRVPIASSTRATSPSNSGEIEAVSDPNASKIPPGESNQA
jgi:hypothetical protein